MRHNFINARQTAGLAGIFAYMQCMMIFAKKIDGYISHMWALESANINEAEAVAVTETGRSALSFKIKKWILVIMLI